MEYKTIKIIDLLNKKANGEELPKIIIYDSYIYRLEYDDYFCDKKNEWLFEDNAFTTEFLNEKIEILEDEKKTPEKLETYKEINNVEHFANILKVSKDGECEIDEATSVIIDKINEILDYLESEKN